jgi:hypothetical protein
MQFQRILRTYVTKSKDKRCKNFDLKAKSQNHYFLSENIVEISLELDRSWRWVFETVVQSPICRG